MINRREFILTGAAAATVAALTPSILSEDDGPDRVEDDGDLYHSCFERWRHVPSEPWVHTPASNTEPRVRA